MAISLQEIGNGGEFHLRFKKTKIFKRIYGENEILIDEFIYDKGKDEFPSEIIYMPSVGRGLLTWFNFNKVERFEKHGIIDYHRNLFLSDWVYSKKVDLEMVKAGLNGEMFDVTIVKYKEEYLVHILFGFENYYFRIEYSEPFGNLFE